jgi:uncharacterized MAPEG superfamily protein
MRDAQTKFSSPEADELFRKVRVRIKWLLVKIGRVSLLPKTSDNDYRVVICNPDTKGAVCDEKRGGPTLTISTGCYIEDDLIVRCFVHLTCSSSITNMFVLLEELKFSTPIIDTNVAINARAQILGAEKHAAEKAKAAENKAAEEKVASELCKMRKRAAKAMADVRAADAIVAAHTLMALAEESTVPRHKKHKQTSQ